MKPLATLAFLVAAPLLAQERTLLHDGWSFAREGEKGARPAQAAFQAVALPTAWEAHEGADFDGVGWYRKTLTELGAADHEKRVRVTFHGAATRAEVFLNGSALGTHLGAWTPFTCELAGARCDGKDLLEVRLDELVGHNTQGFLPIVQPHFGGLWKEIELDRASGPRLVRERLFAFGEGSTLRYESVVADGPHPEATTVSVAIEIAPGKTLRTSPAPAGPGELAVPGIEPWSPQAPRLHTVHFVLSDAKGRELDRVTRKVGFRTLAADGTALRWNGAPLQVRGVLHWGFEPPGFAPNLAIDAWRKQFRDLKAAGFNLVKACLWLPPRAFYDAADEVGLLVWQEYPTWHPKLTQAHRADLEREFDEFFTYDRSACSVAFRSLTCETGHSADLGVIRALYDRAHARIPNTLVVDDSSWIEWNRVHDFWDDHPYGNNSWWPGKLDYFAKYVAEHGKKPLLLGEAITGDTWVDLPLWDRKVGADTPWWAPVNLADQRKVEAALVARFGAGTAQELVARSLDYVMQNRKYQIERFRTTLPDAGYVVSVIRDFRLARMGLYDPHGELKWKPDAWSWQRDVLLALDTTGDRRAFASGKVELALRLANSSANAIASPLHWTLTRADGTTLQHESAVEAAAGALSEKVVWTPELATERPERLRLSARCGGCENAWSLWLLPKEAAPVNDSVKIVDRLDRATLRELEDGARILLRAANTKGSLRTREHQYYRGAPFVPPHAFAERVPPQLLYDLQSLDLETSRTLDLAPLLEEIDPLLLVWDSHDVPEVRLYPLVAETKVGKGRLVVTTLATDSVAGHFVERQLVAHLAGGPAPARALSATTLEKLAGALRAEVVDLPTWELQLDPKDLGLSEGWPSGTTQAGTWKSVKAGLHWEKQGFEHQDGIGWYRTTVAIPEAWRGTKVTLVAEGVDDSYRLYVNGKEVARHGDPAKGETVWLVRTTSDVTAALRPGEPNRIVLRVVDHAGAGGLWKPIFLTTGPADASSDLLH